MPLVVRAIQAAQAATSIERVFVSTDDKEIAATAEHAGAELILRPRDISGDTASSESALLHALEVFERQGRLPSVLVFLQCTAPFIAGRDIDACVAALDDLTSSAFAAIADHGFLWSVSQDGAATGVNHDKKLPRKRRQNLPPQYRECGSIYAMKVQAFRESRSRFCGVTKLVPVSPPHIEIDSFSDLHIARAFCNQKDVSDRGSEGLRNIRALAMDFDGVLTDDQVITLETGVEAVSCSRSDGLGISILKSLSLPIVIISRETNPVVSVRANKLGIEVRQGITRKLDELRKWADEKGLSLESIAYIGNDVTDVTCMTVAGWSAAPADANEDAKASADYICRKDGGRGAVREVCDLLAHQLEAQLHDLEKIPLEK
ncbi:MAG: hypothetical protein RJB62_1090 [Pseudomonadota bacterium]